MAFKLISATEAKSGTTISIDGNPCIVKSNDISKTGKHGHAKCRIEAISILDGKKKILVAGGHDRFEVPMVNKNRAQILSISEGKANVMDLESFETLDIPLAEDVEVNEGDNVEYWDIEGNKIVKRKI